MILLGTFSMFTDYNYHGQPIETSCVSVTIDDRWANRPDIRDELRWIAIERLHTQAKCMPHVYWTGRR